MNSYSSLFFFLVCCLAATESTNTNCARTSAFPERTGFGTFGFCTVDPNLSKGTVNLNLQVSSSKVVNSTSSKCYLMNRMRSPEFTLCMYPPEEDLISKYVNESGLWESTKTLMLSIFLKEQMEKPSPRTIMLDFGANQGYYGFMAAAHGYKVIMLEPGPRTADLLRQTIITNGWQARVTVFRNALGNIRQALSFNFAAGNSGASVVKPDMNGDVHSILPDDLLANLKFHPQQVFAVKIDTEGFDFHVLDGMYNIIKYGRPPVIIMEVPRNSNCNITLAIETMYDAGYVAINEYEPNKQVPLEEVLANLAGSQLPELILVDSHKHPEMAAHINNPHNY